MRNTTIQDWNMKKPYRPLLSPLNDAVFKMIFGDSRNVENLTALLQSTLTIPVEDYEEVTLVNPHLAREGWDDKLSILDVKLKTRSGRTIDIEVVRHEVAQVIVPLWAFTGRNLMFRHQ
jgi:hypothetical protein